MMPKIRVAYSTHAYFYGAHAANMDMMGKTYSPKLRDFNMWKKMAEREGFEPSVPF
jgi:hypothetical protein